MIKIDGRQVADEMLADLKKLGTIKKKLAFLSFEHSDAFSSFVSEQMRVANILGLSARVLYKAETKNTQELIDDLRRFGDNEDVGGIILQMPLPKRFDVATILSNIPVAKDVDCLNPLTKEFSPVVSAVRRIFSAGHFGMKLEDVPGAKVCLVGSGSVIGKPLARYFEKIFWYTAMLNSKASIKIAASAELIITATGIKGLIRPELLKAGADLIDFGYPGDVAEDGMHMNNLGTYTPSKGGTGPILVASAFENFYRLNGLL